MRIAICDDEPEYRRIIREKILEDSFAHDYETEAEEYGSGSMLLEAVDGGMHVDVFFLDVQMERGTGDGIRVGRELRRRGDKGLIVYVTSFIDYVQTGYEVKAFRYLLKSQLQEELPEVLADIRRELEGEEYCFRTGGETVCINKRDILYLESRGRMLRLVTTGEEYSFYGSLPVEEKALGGEFLRCHRSFLVHTNRIRKYSGGQIELQDGSAIPVSRSYAKCVHQRLMLEMR